MVIQEVWHRERITALLPVTSTTIAIATENISKAQNTLLVYLPVEGGATHITSNGTGAITCTIHIPLTRLVVIIVKDIEAEPPTAGCIIVASLTVAVSTEVDLIVQSENPSGSRGCEERSNDGSVLHNEQ